MSKTGGSVVTHLTIFDQIQSESEEAGMASLKTTDRSIIDSGQSAPSLVLLPIPALLFFTPLMVVIIVISVGGNVMVLMSYKHPFLFVDAHSLYLLHLAVSDLLISVVCMPLHLISTLCSSGWPLGRVMCKAYTAVQLTLLNVTTLVLVLVALDSFFQANEGVKVTGMAAKKKAYLMLGACWTLAVVVHLPETLNLDVIRGHSVCKPEFYRSVARVLFMLLWDFFLPVLILSVVNTLLYFRLRQLSRRMLNLSRVWQTQEQSCCADGPNMNLETHEIRALLDVGVIIGSKKGSSNNDSTVTLQPYNECRCLEGKYLTKPGTSAKNASASVGIKRTFSTIPGDFFEEMINLAGSQGTEREEPGGASSKLFVPYTNAVNPQVLESKRDTGEILVGSRSETVRPEGEQLAIQTKATTFRHLPLESPYRLRRVAVNLFTLVLILVVCWLPYSVASLLGSICQACVHPVVYGLLVWVLYVKSCINPFLYAYNTFTFRQRFRRLLARVLPTKSLRRMTTDRVSDERASILN